MAYEFPKINSEDILALRLFVRDCGLNPELLEESPYPDVIKDTVRSILNKSEVKTNNKRKLSDIDYEAETIALYDSIQAIDDLGTIDPKEKIAIIKLRTGILQQLLDMLKESRRIKEIYRFEDIVFSILTEEQKDKLLKEGE